jgi:hypothetical protein
MKLEFSRHIFEKYSNVLFHGNVSSGNECDTVSSLSSAITGINEIHAARFATVLKTLPSEYRTDSEDFDQYTQETITLYLHIYSWPSPVATRSKVWVYGRSLAGIVSSNAAGGMDVCLL